MGGQQGKLLRTLLKVLLIAFAAFVLFLVIVLFISMKATAPLAEVADQHLTYLKEGNVQQAYDNTTSAEFKQAVSLEDYQSFLEENGIVPGLESWSISSREFENDYGKVQGTMKLNEGTEIPFSIEMTRKDSGWKITYIEFGN